MKLDISELARTPGMRATQEINEPCSPEEFDVDCVSPITGRIELMNTGELLLVRGNISTEIRLVCSRCVTEFTVPVQANIEEQFRLVHTTDQIVAVPMEGAEVVHGHILNVDELIRQNLLTEVPFQPLCRPDCKGLCPTCGQNLSEGECACPKAPPESPLQALAALLTEEEETEE